LHPDETGRGYDDGDTDVTPPSLRKKRKFPIWSWVGMLVVGVLVAVFAWRQGYEAGAEAERARVAASASATAKVTLPADLYCPLPNSDEGKRAIRTQPVVDITDSLPKKLLVMRKAAVVVVDVELSGDVVVCGNDAVLFLKKTPRDSARILMQGGTDTKTVGAGPVIYTLAGVQPPPPNRVWFSNGKPRIVECSIDAQGSPALPRSCESYFSTVPPSATPRATR
jgi:hypothetical protein